MVGLTLLELFGRISLDGLGSWFEKGNVKLLLEWVDKEKEDGLSIYAAIFRIKNFRDFGRSMILIGRNGISCTVWSVS